VYTVLYVDDEPDMLELGKFFLEQNGQFSVDTITSASAALSLMAEREYDAIISDYQMPGMDGIGFLQRVRGSGNTIPFILFTGRGREEIVIQALNEGVDFYLQKGGEPMSQFAELSHKILQAVSRRKAEIALSDSEQRLTDLINFLPDATFAIDTGGKVIAWNRAIEEMTGMPAADMLGKGDFEYALPFYGKRQPILVDMIFQPDEKIAEFYINIQRDGKTLSAESHLPQPKGRHIWILAKASPLYNRNGDITGAIEAIRDITESRELMEALRESEEQYRLLVENANDAIFLHEMLPDGRPGRYLMVNDIACQRLGYSRDEMLRMSAGDIASPGRSPGIREISERLQREGHITFEAIHRRKDGSGFPVENSIILFELKGRKVALSFARDITERKKSEADLHQTEERIRDSEEFLRTVITGAKEGIIVYDRDLRIMLWNRFMEEMTGLPAAEVLGKKAVEIFPFIREKGIEALMNKALAGISTASPDFEFLIRSTGRKGWVKGIYSPNYNAHGAIIGVIGIVRNVTERKQAEELIRDSERFIREVITSAKEGIIVYDRELRYVIWNRFMENISGIPAADLLGKKAIEVFPHLEDLGIQLLLQRALSGETVESPDTQPAVNYHGKKRWMKGIYSPHYDAQGNIIGVVGIVRDVSAQREMEASLKDSEERYRNVVEDQTEFISRFLPDGTHVFVNEAYCRYFGLKRDEILGHRFRPKIPAEDKNLVKQFFESLTPDHPVDNIEQRIIMPDGTIRWQRWSDRAIFDKDGKLQEYQSVGRDITERKHADEALKESEEWFSVILNAAQVGIILVDAESHKILGANPKALALLGASNRDITNAVCHKFICPAEEGKCPVTDLGQVVNSSERILITKDGENLPIMKTVVSTQIGTRKVLVESFIDITERKATEAALRESNRKLNLLSSITRHDINNQLLAVLGYTQLAALMTPDPIVGDFLAKITTAVDTIQHQIEFTRTYQDLGVHAPAWFRVCDVIRGVRPPEVSLVCTCGACEIFVDPMITKVFFNLFDNAVRYGERVTTVTVGCEETGDEMVITFADNGIGIPLDEKQKIFEKGYGRHTGFGLFLAREILAITGISIFETGTHGKGARFEIAVPKGAYRSGGSH
jgi:PAS domain S-box-containing protein